MFEHIIATCSPYFFFFLSVLKSDVLDNLDLLKTVFLLLFLVASWTQMLTESHTQTMLLVGVDLKSIVLVMEQLRLDYLKAFSPTKLILSARTSKIG